MLYEDIKTQAESGHRHEMKKLVQQAVEQGCDPGEIIEQALIPAVNILGRTEMDMDNDIVKILAVARCVQEGLDLLTPYLNEDVNYNVGAAIIGTVEGDLHDIGKNILSLMFQCNGIKVIDLGVNVSKNEFLKAIKAHPEAQIVCLSSLLTTLLPEMKKSVAAVKKYDKKKKLLVMVGGACVTESFANEIGADVYTSNAVDCAKIARAYLLKMNQKDRNQE